MNRTEAIIILEGFKDNPLFNSTHAQALDMAIASLKTDEAYQLEYENRDFVEIPEGMTNGEVIQAIYRFHSDMNCGSNGEYVHIWSNDGKCQMTIHKDFWNAPYQKGGEEE